MLNFGDLIKAAAAGKRQVDERDRLLHHLEQAERILNQSFGGVGVKHLDACRMDLITEEFPHE